jgi:hypothetical protein
MTRETFETHPARHMILVAVSVIASGLLTVDLAGYTLSGKKWATNKVNYYINPVNVHVTEDAAIAAIQSAAAVWTRQSRASIEFVYAGRTNGSAMQLNYKNEVLFRQESGGAYTTWWSDGSGNIIDADIVFYTLNRPLFTGTTGCAGGVYIEDLGSHEFGHALGLAHSSDTSATMYATMSSYCAIDWRQLAPDDIAAVEVLYPPLLTAAPNPPTNLRIVR